jgi:DNA helicase HerA-like ATPase
MANASASDRVVGFLLVGVYAVALVVSAAVQQPLVLVLLAAAGGAVILIRYRQNRSDENRREADREAYQERQSERTKEIFLDEVNCYFPFLTEPFQERVSNGEAPEDALLNALYDVPATDIGTTMYGLPARLPLAERTRHLYVVGKTGSGKTSLLLRLIQDDLETGRGLCVVAPEAELFRDWLLPMVPEERADSVVYFAPGQLDNPVTFNPLALEPGDDRGRATGELLSIFRSALGDAELGARMTPILGNIFSVLVNRPDSTLWDVPRLLVDAAFREEAAKGTNDPYLREFWLHTYPSYPKGAHLPILNRLDQFLRPESVRQALCHPVSTLAIRRALSSRGILFFDLSRLDPGSMLLIGQMLLSKFQLELMRREEVPETERAPFHLYADEFQTFAGVAEGTWRELLSRGRRYGVALTLAHQHPSQLPRGLQDEILGNVASIVAFGLSAKDAEVVRKELLELPAVNEPARPIDRERVLRLRVGEAVARLGGGNFAIPLKGSSPLEKPAQVRGQQIVARSWKRFGIPLETRQAHAPTRPSSKPQVTTPKTRAAPESCPETGLVIGHNKHGATTRAVALTPAQRTQHMYVIGSSGTGKSTFLLNCISQGMRAGEGLAVLDPHGDLIDEILARVPAERYDDVVLVDLADRDFPVGFNVLSAHSDVEKEILASDLVGVFQRLSSRWGDQMNSILANAIHAFLESEAGGTLSDLRRFLVEEDFRKAFLTTVKDPDIVYYWTREFPLLAGKPQASLLTRLDAFLRPKLIRNMVSQKQSRLDFGEIMDRGRILLAKLSQGSVGEENAYLLGSLLVSKFYQLAIARQAVSPEERRPFYLYVDECHNFLTPSMASILSGARKYQLGLILAHQELQQLSGKDTDILSAVITNPYARVCFRLGDLDAKRLEKGFSHFDAGDFQTLGVGEALCRVGRADHDFNLKTENLPVVDPNEAKARREQLIGLSRQRYATPRQDIETARGSETPPTRIPLVHEVAPEAPLPALSTTKSKPLPDFDVPVPSLPRLPGTGHGGDQHRYLQSLVKRWAESRGFRASLEHEVLGGTGRVDVALEKPNLKIAVEVSVSTDTEHELQNIQKGLAAGFDHVAVICQKAASERALRERIAQAEGQDGARIHVVSADGLFDLVDRLDAERRQETSTVRGYAVKVGYTGLTREEQRARKATISTVIARALRSFKT